jgi:hypothetical protein
MLSGRGNKKIQHFKFLLIGRGVTDRSISFEMIGRHGGEKPRFLPYGEPAEANAVSAGALAPGRQVLRERVLSGRGESNPRTRLGRPLHCHCATPASGCWELNPGHILPRDAYYRYTTPRFPQ